MLGFMAERNGETLGESYKTSSGISKRRFKLLENETHFMNEENDENIDSPEELLLPDDHPVQQREVIIRQWLSSNTEASFTEEEGNEIRQCVAGTKDTGIFSRVKVSGSCMCKLLVVIYLLGCLLVSTLYIVIYGPNELYVVPETPRKPFIKPPMINPVMKFYDNPYTEWTTQRWTYDNDPFADWPTLPEFISSIQQVANGKIGNTEGVWLLDTQALYFMHNITARDDVGFRNISDQLDLNVPEGSRVCMKSLTSLYLITPDSVVLLDCSSRFNLYCEISYQWSTQELSAISSAVVSGNDGYLWVGTNSGLYRFNTTPTPPATPMQMPNNPEIVSNDRDNQFMDEFNATMASFFRVIEVEGPVISLAWRGGLTGHKGWGLHSNAFLFTNYSTHFPQNVSFSSGTSWYNGTITNSALSADDFGLLVIGTHSKLYFFDGHMVWFEWVSQWSEGVGGVIDGAPVSLTFVPTGELFIGNNVSLSRLNIDYTFDRIGGSEGLPYNEILSLHYSSLTPKAPSPLKPLSVVKSFTRSTHGVLWIGTKKGWSLFNIGNSRFTGYFYGPRWHPGSSVMGLAEVGSDDSMVVLTNEGISVVTAEEWTLEKKAIHYQNMLSRHIRSPGLVADCDLTDYVPSSCSPGSNDNDGLWTSWLVAAEALRYKVNKSEEARSNSWRFYKAMKFLVDVTGIRGLPARSVIRINMPNKQPDTDNDEVGESGWGEEPGTPTDQQNEEVLNISSYGPNWHHSISNPGWIWKGDTSSDEIVGHIFANTIAYDLVATTTEEKRQVAQTLDSIIGYIKDNNYTLIDITNMTTHWGVWSPSTLNLNQSWADEHGLNSLQILAGLLSAYRITGKTEYFKEWKALFNGTSSSSPAHYGLNIINQKITFPRDINYSDDELAFLPYFVYFQTLKYLRGSNELFNDQEMFMIPMLSLLKTWRSVEKEKSAAWHTIYGNITGDDSLTEDIVWSLRNWPLELIQWKTENSHRLDITFRRGQDRFFNSGTQSERVLSPRERTQLRWNGNPYQLDYAGASNEMDPGPWLMSYWMAKWTRLL